MSARVQPLFPDMKRHRYSEAFDGWWKVAGDHIRRKTRLIGKAHSAVEFAKICPSQISVADLIHAVIEYGKFCRTEERFPRDPVRFLRDRLWEDFMPDEDEPQDHAPAEVKSEVGGQLTEDWRNVLVRLHIDNQAICRAWFEPLVLTGTDHMDRPILRAPGSFAGNYIRGNLQQQLNRAWGREVVVQ